MALTKTDSTAPSVVTLMPAVGSREVKARIDPKNVSHIIGRLTQLYNNPIHATVRETVSNATDASAAMDAASRKPVEIETPNSLQKLFIVRDYGVGMSARDVEDIYANYGASTKGEDVGAIGSYGLGGKAPLAYTNSFEITTTKDGITTNFTMARSGGETKTTIRSITETGLPSGTEVKIPVESSYDTDAFSEAVDFYKHHSHSSAVIVDGERYEGNSDYFRLGAATIYEDNDGAILGNVYLHHSYLATYFNSVTNYGLDTSSISYSLSGWLYAADGTSKIEIQPVAVVELVPALVNFGSSRDAITNDEKLRALNTRVKAALSSSEFIERALAEYRKLDRKELNSFCYQTKNHFNIAEDEKDFRLGRAYTGSIDLLKVDLGFNPFLFYSLKLPPSATLAFMSSSDNELRYRTASLRDDKIDKHTTYRVSEIVSAYALADTRGKLSIGKLAAEFMGNAVELVVVTGVSDVKFKSLVRSRKALFTPERRNRIYILTDHTSRGIKKEDIAFAKLVLGDEAVTITNVEDLLALIKPELDKDRAERRNERKSRVSFVMKQHRYISTLRVDNFDDPKLVAEASFKRAEPESFQQVFETDGVLLMGSGWRAAYVGAINAGVKLQGKSIYVYDRKITVDEAKQLMEYQDRIYFSTTSDLTTVAARKLADGRVYTGSTLNTVLAALTLEQLVAGMVSYTMYDYNVLKMLAPRLKTNDSIFRKVFDAYTVVPKNREAIDASTARRELSSRFGESYVEALERISRGLARSTSYEEGLDARFTKLVLEDSRKGELQVTPIIEAVFERILTKLEEARTETVS